MSFEQRIIEVEGFRTRYIAAGTGPAVVLLHAGGESSSDWQWTISALADTYSVYAPNLHGLGEEDFPTIQYTTDFLFRFVMQFLTKLHIEHATIVGNSLGGLIGMQVALASPSQVQALVLVDSAGLGREISPFVTLAALPGLAELATTFCMTPLGALQRAVFKIPLLFSQTNRVPEKWFMEQYRLAQTPYFMAATLSALRSQLTGWEQREVLLEELPRMEIPTLLIWGQYDQIIPIMHAHHAMERLKNGRMVVVPGCGHMPHVEQPEEFASALKSFLDEHARSNGG
jgi:4,5:9,10-diseco-3-hydroxy-5,9,17-trioxoandrosta-1(10),2-diene-4-oate hydrolase